MGVVRNAANTKIRGRVGQTTYYVSGQQQIARQALNNSNYGETARRSEAQQNRRVLWANLVNFYKVSAGWMPKAFETKKPNQSDYNKFMQVNVGVGRVALTKAESQAGAVVADEFIVSQGSLPSIKIDKVGLSWRTNLAIGDLTIGTTTTNAQLTEALVANNAHVRAGMQLSFVSYQQSVDALGTPRLICRCYEITLDPNSSDLVRDFIPDFGSTSSEGYLGTSANVSVGGFVYILSELNNGVLRVSTQQLVANNGALLQQYTGAVQRQRAIDSYGVDSEVILSPTGTISQTAEQQPQYIQYVLIGSVRYNAGDYYGVASALKSKDITIYMSSTNNLTEASAVVTTTSGGEAELTVSEVTGKIIEIGSTASLSLSGVLSQLIVVDAAGTQHILQFATTQPSGGNTGSGGELN